MRTRLHPAKAVHGVLNADALKLQAAIGLAKDSECAPIADKNGGPISPMTNSTHVSIDFPRLTQYFMQNVENGIGADQTPTNSGIIPNPRLAAMLAEHGLEKSDADKLQEALSGSFAIFDEWEAKNEKIVVERADQVAEMALASEGAKKVAKARTTFTNSWKKVKEPYLKSCQALDAVNRIAVPIFKSLEEQLEAKAATGARLAQAERDLLIANRKAALIAVGHNGEIPGLGEMSEETFEMILGGAKEKVRLAREQAEREAAELAAAQEAERVENERLANRERLGQSRRLELVQLGAKIEGGSFNTYVLGNVEIQDSRLFDMGDSEWADCLQEFTNEAQRIADEEAARLALVDRTFKRKLQLIEIGLKAVNGDDYEYFEIGKRSIYVRTIESMDESSWENAVGEFQKEAQRIANEEAEKTARKDRFQSRVKTLIALGAKEITDAENDRLELGNSKVMLDALYSLNEEDERWSFTLQSFQDEAKRLKQLADQVALQERERLQTANDRLAALRNVDFVTTFEAVADLTDVEFDALLKVKTTEHSAKKAAQERADRGRTRKELSLAYGEDRHWEYLADMTDAEWEAFHANSIRLKQLADQDKANEAAQAAIEAQRKADEAAKLKADEIARKKAESATDKEKLEEMVKQIQAIVMPTCTSIQGDAIARGAIERLGKLVGHMHEAMQQM